MAGLDVQRHGETGEKQDDFNYGQHRAVREFDRRLPTSIPDSYVSRFEDTVRQYDGVDVGKINCIGKSLRIVARETGDEALLEDAFDLYDEVKQSLIREGSSRDVGSMTRTIEKTVPELAGVSEDVALQFYDLVESIDDGYVQNLPLIGESLRDVAGYGDEGLVEEAINVYGMKQSELGSRQYVDSLGDAIARGPAIAAESEDAALQFYDFLGTSVNGDEAVFEEIDGWLAGMEEGYLEPEMLVGAIEGDGLNGDAQGGRNDVGGNGEAVAL